VRQIAAALMWSEKSNDDSLPIAAPLATQALANFAQQKLIA
jgi:hypothetical protein